jgi:hypothetical protein
MRSALLRLAPAFAIWGAAAVALAIPARRVVDWFWMTDELLYERLAFSIVHTGSPLPSLHGQRVPVTNFLYPLILSTVAGNHLVPTFLTRAHTLNAIMMTSAAVPAYLTARAVLRTQLAAYTAAALTVLVPWMIFASFLLTESAAYPACLWAVYLLQRMVARPSPLADTLALGGLLLALLTRTQLVVLFAVAPLAVVLYERSFRIALRRHRVLAATTAVAAVVVVAVIAAGHGATLLGNYRDTAGGSWLTTGMARAVAQHAAELALGIGLLPAVVGAAWLSARALKREPLPLVSILAIVVVLLEVTSFDVRFGYGLTHDRYLFYLAPLLLIGFLGALEDARLPRWSLAAPLVIVLAGLAAAKLPVFDKLNAETPVSTLDGYLVRTGHGVNGARATLIVCALLLLAVLALSRALLPRTAVLVVFAAATALFLTGETAYAFKKLFSVNGTAGRPITVSQGAIFDWLDHLIGPNQEVTMVTYAQVPRDYWATAAFWWDLEFWNRSITRAAYPGNRFAEQQATFPKLHLTFDPSTGFANTSPTRYVALSDRETRFRIAGPSITMQRDVRVIDATRPWRLDWMTFGLDDDGFTVPGRRATIRLFPAPDQRTPLMRYVSVQLQAHGAPQGAQLSSPAGDKRVQLDANADTIVQVQACVPPRGHATIGLLPSGTARVYGDLGARAGIYESRVRGVQVVRISVADETSPC